MTDIRLDDSLDSVTIEGTAVELRGAAHPSTLGRRRALVHTEDDGLSINGSGDYPDGVRLAGVRRIKGRPENGLEVTEVAAIKGRIDGGLEVTEIARMEGAAEKGLQMSRVHFIEGVEAKDPIDEDSAALFPTAWSTRISIGGDIMIQMSPTTFLVPGFTNWVSLQTVIKKLQDRVAELERKLGE